MRVLFLSPSNRLLGARKSLIDVVTHLPADIDPLVVCPGDGELARVLAGHGIATERVGHHPWRKLLGHIQARLFQLPALRRIARRFRPAIVHANEYHIVPQARRAARGSPRPRTSLRVPPVPAQCTGLPSRWLAFEIA